MDGSFVYNILNVHCNNIIVALSYLRAYSYVKEPTEYTECFQAIKQVACLGSGKPKLTRTYAPLTGGIRLVKAQPNVINLSGRDEAGWIVSEGQLLTSAVRTKLWMVIMFIMVSCQM